VRSKTLVGGGVQRDKNENTISKRFTAGEGEKRLKKDYKTVLTLRVLGFAKQKKNWGAGGG